MSKKYFLTKWNSPYGIQKDGLGNQYYSHIVDFPNDVDDKNKKQFVKDYLGFDMDDTENMKLYPEQAESLNTSNTANIKVDITDYPDETLETMLDKDAMIVYDEATSKFSFWAVEGHRVSNNTLVVAYAMTRDWLFEKGINNMFRDDRDVIINRGMTDNVVSLTDNGEGRWNISPDSDNFYPEDFEEFQQGSYKPKKVIDFAKDYSPIITVNKKKNDTYTASVNEDKRTITVYLNGSQIGLFNVPDSWETSWYQDNLLSNKPFIEYNGENEISFSFIDCDLVTNYEHQSPHVYYANCTFDLKSRTFIDNGVVSWKIWDASFPTGSTTQVDHELSIGWYKDPKYPKPFITLLYKNDWYSMDIKDGYIGVRMGFLNPWINHGQWSWKSLFSERYHDDYSFYFNVEFRHATGLNSIPGVYIGISQNAIDHADTKYDQLFVPTNVTDSSFDFKEYDGPNKTINGLPDMFNFIRVNNKTYGFGKYYRTTDDSIIGYNYDDKKSITNPGVSLHYDYAKIIDYEKTITLLTQSADDKDTVIVTYDPNSKQWSSITTVVKGKTLNTDYYSLFENTKTNVYSQIFNKGGTLIVSPTSYLYDPNYDLTPFDIVKALLTPTEEEAYYHVNSLLNNGGFAIVKFQTKKDNNNNDILPYGAVKIGDNVQTNYYQFNGNYPKVSFEANNEVIENNLHIMLLPHFELQTPNTKVVSFNEAYDRLQASAYVYQITNAPFNVLDNMIKGISVTRNADKSWNMVFTFSDEANIVSGKDIAGSKSPVVNFLSISTLKDYDYETDIYSANKATYNTKINEKFIPDNLAKLHKYPYMRLQLKTAIGNTTDIIQDYLLDKFTIKASYTYEVSSNHTYFKVNDIDNPSGIYNSDLKFGLNIEDINQFSFMQTNDIFNQLIATNGQQINQSAKWNKQNLGFTEKQNKLNMAKSIANAGLQTVGGVLGGALTGNLYGAIAGGVSGAVSGGTGIAQTALSNKIALASAKNDIEMLNAKIGDAQNSPNQLVGNGDDMTGVITKTTLQPEIYELELWPALKEKIAWYFQIWGVNLGSLPRKINEYLDNRYYFNYIEANSAFENYREDVPLTNEVRQIIDKSLSQGITIWHYRNPETFKGIKNYNVNNVETKYATMDNSFEYTFEATFGELPMENLEKINKDTELLKEIKELIKEKLYV